MLLSHFSSSPRAIEHGHPALAPFLGREFVGLDGVADYFKLIQQHLRFDNMGFSEWVVDAHAMRVAVKGTARFTWTETGEAWDEVFAYVLDMVEEEDGGVKVGRYQVWADSGAAYLARKGKLGEVEGEKG